MFEPARKQPMNSIIFPAERACSLRAGLAPRLRWSTAMDAKERLRQIFDHQGKQLQRTNELMQLGYVTTATKGRDDTGESIEMAKTALDRIRTARDLLNRL